MKIQSHPIILASGLIVAGLTIGWRTRSAVTALNPPLLVKSPPHSARRHESQPTIIKTNTKWQNFASHVSEMSNEEKKAFAENITPQDRRVAIEALLTQGGPGGFDSEIKQVIDQLLGSWVSENFEEVWAWSRQLKSEGTKNFMAGMLLDILLKTDPSRALNLYLELEQTHPGFKSKVPEKVLASAALKNAQEFLDFAGKFRFGWDAGESCEFAKDFNFQQVADGIAKFSKKEESKLPWGFPSNFYHVWAVRDREAAFASFTGGELSRLESLDGFLGNLEDHSNPEAVWNWVAEKIQKSEVSSKAIRRGLCGLESVSINGIIQALPDAAVRDRFLIQVACEYGEIPTIAISAMSSSKARLEAFSQLRKQDYYELDITKFTEADLQAWGVTRQQITDIFSAPVDKLPNSN
jgi:hypothetical protein